MKQFMQPMSFVLILRYSIKWETKTRSNSNIRLTFPTNQNQQTAQEQDATLFILLI